MLSLVSRARYNQEPGLLAVVEADPLCRFEWIYAGESIPPASRASQNA